jgi:hypothetical protein
VLDRREVAHRGGRGGRDVRVREVDAGQEQRVGAEAAAAGRGQEVAALLVLAVDDDLAAVEPVEEARRADGAEGDREAADDEHDPEGQDAPGAAGDEDAPAPEQGAVVGVRRGHGVSVPRSRGTPAEGGSRRQRHG